MMFFGVPIVWILTSHQRKMAEMIHGRYAGTQNDQAMAALIQEVQQLRAEVAQLRDQNNRIAIQSDELRLRLPAE